MKKTFAIQDLFIMREAVASTRLSHDAMEYPHLFLTPRKDLTPEIQKSGIQKKEMSSKESRNLNNELEKSGNSGRWFDILLVKMLVHDRIPEHFWYAIA